MYLPQNPKDSVNDEIEDKEKEAGMMRSLNIRARDPTCH